VLGKASTCESKRVRRSKKKFLGEGITINEKKNGQNYQRRSALGKSQVEKRGSKRQQESESISNTPPGEGKESNLSDGELRRANAGNGKRRAPSRGRLHKSKDLQKRGGFVEGSSTPLKKIDRKRWENNTKGSGKALSRGRRKWEGRSMVSGAGETNDDLRRKGRRARIFVSAY